MERILGKVRRYLWSGLIFNSMVNPFWVSRFEGSTGIYAIDGFLKERELSLSFQIALFTGKKLKGHSPADKTHVRESRNRRINQVSLIDLCDNILFFIHVCSRSVSVILNYPRYAVIEAFNPYTDPG